VYTWVNGSDPVWKAKLLKYKTDDRKAEQARTFPSFNETTLMKLIQLRNELRNLSKSIEGLHRDSGRQYVGNVSYEESLAEQLVQFAETSISAKNDSSIIDPDLDLIGTSDVVHFFDQFISHPVSELPEDFFETYDSYAEEQSAGDDTQGEYDDAEEDSDDTQSASDNRYRDNEELRYSLRSIEKYAPWIRHIYIVTDNQIPSWLDLSNSRISIVPHTDIFKNASHLPSFSSPSIEANIHHIRGLASKFVYFNDDVMLGSDIWPEDFYTTRGGQKIYLTWELPQCSSGCMASWLGDGVCDPSCNNDECNFDYTDCNKEQEIELQGDEGHLSSKEEIHVEVKHKFCSERCENSFLGDEYCDTHCDSLECAFDAGDCIGHAPVRKSEPPLVSLSSNDTFHAFTKGHLNLPIGTRSVILNMTDHFALLGDLKTVYYSRNDIIAHASFNAESRLLHVVFYRPDSILHESTLWHGRNISMLLEMQNASFVTHVESFLAGCSLEFGCEQFTDMEQAQRMCSLRGDQCGGVTSSNVYEPPIRHELRLGKLPQKSETHEISYLKHSNNVVSSCGPDDLPPINVSVRFHFHDNSWVNLTMTAGAPVPEQCLRRMLSTTDEFSARDQQLKAKFLQVYEEYQSLIPLESSAYSGGRRSLLDYFGQSLLHVDWLYHQAFNEIPEKNPAKKGYSNGGRKKSIRRRVPAHMPHFIDRDQMVSLQSRFPAEFAATSSHRFRDPKDMQYSFSYMYWMVEQSKYLLLSRAEFFKKEVDTDGDGVLSSNELRTLAAGDNDSPDVVDEKMQLMLSCMNVTEVTLKDVLECDISREIFENKIPRQKTYQFIEEKDSPVAFEMIDDDYRSTLSKLDSIRSRKPKFICVNDNMKHPSPSLIHVLHQFQNSLFPLPSQFELPSMLRNRFLYYDEYISYLRWRKLGLFSAIFLVICLVSYYYINLQKENQQY